MRQVALLAVFIFLCAVFSAASEETGKPPDKAAAVRPDYAIKEEGRRAMDRSDLIREIKGEILDAGDEVFENIEGLKKNTDESGGVYYSYHTDAGDIKLEDLDEATLNKLLSKIYVKTSDMMVQRNMENLQEGRDALEASHRPTALKKIPRQYKK